MLFCLALCAGLNGLAYLPSLHAPFEFDDYANILNEPRLREAGDGRASLLALAIPHLHARRSLASFSFALNLRLFGRDPFSFHVVNLIIHVLNAWLVLALILTVRQVLKREEFKTRASGLETRPDLLPAFFGALLWSLHPGQVQAVTYVVQRMTSLATLFYLLGFFSGSRPGCRPGAGRSWASAWPR